MKAAQIVRFGPPSVITNDDLPRPEPGPGQLLVRYHRACEKPDAGDCTRIVVRTAPITTP